jgi:hypothetical protein
MIIKIFCYLLFAALIPGSLTFAQSSINTAGSGTTVYEGRTPCQELALQLHEEVGEECIKIKWRLTLSNAKPTGSGGEYKMEGFKYRGEKALIGTWEIIKGWKGNAEAAVYRLNQEGKDPLYLLKADENILFFLDHNKEIMVGNSDFSFTLNRVQKR